MTNWCNPPLKLSFKQSILSKNTFKPGAIGMPPKIGFVLKKLAS